jgi:hypothetical protein
MKKKVLVLFTAIPVSVVVFATAAAATGGIRAR